jgi:hypothetical protein
MPRTSRDTAGGDGRESYAGRDGMDGRKAFKADVGVAPGRRTDVGRLLPDVGASTSERTVGSSSDRVRPAADIAAMTPDAVKVSVVKESQRLPETGVQILNAPDRSLRG